MTVSSSSLVDIFISHLEIERNCSKRTQSAYRADLGLLRRFLDDPEFDWREITTSEIRAWLMHLKTARKNKMSSIARRITTLKSFYKFLHENEFIDSNPTRPISTPKLGSSIPQYLERDILLQVLDSIEDETYRAIAEVLYSTGMRAFELHNLNLAAVGLDRREIMIAGGKGDKDRLVFLTDRAHSHLVTYLRGKRARIIRKYQSRGLEPDTGAVFLSNRGSRIAMRTVSAFFSKLGREQGVSLTPHLFRHTFASHLTMANVNFRVIQKLMGHASLQTTQIYANVSGDFMLEEFEKGMGPVRRVNHG